MTLFCAVFPSYKFRTVYNGNNIPVPPVTFRVDRVIQDSISEIFYEVYRSIYFDKDRNADMTVCTSSDIQIKQMCNIEDTQLL